MDQKFNLAEIVNEDTTDDQIKIEEDSDHISTLIVKSFIDYISKSIEDQKINTNAANTAPSVNRG